MHCASPAAAPREFPTAAADGWRTTPPTSGAAPRSRASLPTQSPENRYLAPDGTRCDIDIAPAMSQEIVYDLLTNAIAAAEILAIESEFRERAAAARVRLTPLQIGKHGQIQEWSHDFEEPD